MRSVSNLSFPWVEVSCQVPLRSGRFEAKAATPVKAVTNKKARTLVSFCGLVYPQWGDRAYTTNS